MIHPQIPQPEVHKKLNVDKLMNWVIGLDDWCEKWKQYHLNKNGNGTIHTKFGGGINKQQ